MANIAYVRNDAGTLKFLTDDGTFGACVHSGGGFMGINTMTPLKHLHVNGDAYVSNTTFTSNLTVFPGSTILGFAPSATLDTTNAVNIRSGTLSADRLPSTSVVAGTYGSVNTIPRFDVGQDGRIQRVIGTTVAIATSNISGLAPSATTDTTNATNISHGTLPAARLPVTTVVAAQYPPSADYLPRITVGPDGRLTNADTIQIHISSSQVSGLTDWATSDTNNLINPPATLYGLNVIERDAVCACNVVVGGSVHATSIAAGGSSAKQFDCGTITVSAGTFTIPFHFSFLRVPTVVATPVSGDSGYIFAAQINSASTTGFTGMLNQLHTGSSTVSAPTTIGMNWIAVG